MRVSGTETAIARRGVRARALPTSAQIVSALRATLEN